MTMAPRQVAKWESSDGSLFDSERDARIHEIKMERTSHSDPLQSAVTIWWLAFLFTMVVVGLAVVVILFALWLA